MQEHVVWIFNYEAGFWGQCVTLFCKCLSGRKAVKNKHGLIIDPELERQRDPSPYQKYPCVCVFAHAYVCPFVCVCVLIQYAYRGVRSIMVGKKITLHFSEKEHNIYLSLHF